MIACFLRKSYYLWVGVVALLTACTPPTPPAAPTPPPSPTSPATTTPTVVAVATTPIATGPATSTRQPVTLLTPEITQVVVWESLPPAQAQLLADEITAFQEEFPQFKVTQQHYDSSEGFMSPLLAGEISFDVILASPVLLNSLWAAKKLAPISDFFPPSFVDDFASVTLTGASRAGQLWGLSDTAGFQLLLFYNRDLVDTPPADTDQLVELAQSLTRQEPTRWGLGVNSYDPLWLVPWLAPYGGWLVDRRGQPNLDTPAMESAIKLYLGWHGRRGDKIDPEAAIAPLATYEEVRRLFVEGDLAMLIDGDWAVAELAGVDTLDWGVAPLPAVSQDGNSQPAAPLVLARYWGISRAASGNRVLAATALVEYLTRPERQLAWTTQFGLLPTRRQALNDSLIAGNPALRISAAQMQAGRGVPLGTNTDAILNAMRDPLRAALDGEMTPAGVAEMMQLNLE